ncbi:MAG: hypothetical protein ACXVMS_07355 [Flavisolibacter sp.]
MKQDFQYHYMQLREFKYEDKLKKKQLLFQHGIFLDQRPQEEFIIMLFQIDAFYVEVYFDREEREIGYMRAFSELDLSSPYLQRIDLSVLPLVAAPR